MLIAMSEGSAASSASSLSAGGHDEQPWLVKSSITARGSACAEHGPASEQSRTIAEARQSRIITILLASRDRLPSGRDIAAAAVTPHSIRGEPQRPRT